MIMADVLKIFLIVVGLALVTGACWLASEALFADLVGRCRERYRRRPVRTALLGAALGGPLIFLGLQLLQASAFGKAAGFLLASAVLLLALLGSAGLCRQIGIGLPSPADAAQPWRRVLRGAAVLALVCMLPFVGWFLVLPAVLASGFAAALGAMREASRQAPGAEAGTP